MDASPLALRSPAEIYGPLFAAVQERRILPDGKAFVDATPLRPVNDILRDFACSDRTDAELLAFVCDNFKLPDLVGATAPRAPDLQLRDYIRGLWSELARDPRRTCEGSSAPPLAHRHVVPGGRFREIYYWDSFFTMLGLMRDGERELAHGLVDAMTDLIEAHGYVPNGARTYFLGRSQPPLFYMMVALLGERSPAVAARHLTAMKQEHAWWMAGQDALRPGEQSHRVAMLADGSILNRYWDPRTTPRDESWGEDVTTAAQSDRPSGEVYHDLRAGAESGWDFSSRWLRADTLSSIQTTRILPIDLNAFLYGLERAIAESDPNEGVLYGQRAERRRSAIRAHLWGDEQRVFCDYDLDMGDRINGPTAACLTPLLTGLATQAEAAATTEVVREQLLAPGGLRTTMVESGEQWDKPNGWAPLQWIAVTGLERYGHHELAQEIAQRWIETVETVYQVTGALFEKYNVEERTFGAGGEYAPQLGFGWTNGVAADLMDRQASSGR